MVDQHRTATTEPRPPLPCQRDAFDIPRDVVYLNCSYMAPQLRAVSDAGHRAVQRKQRPWTIGPADFFDDLERLRQLFAALLGGDPDGVAIVPSVSYALATVALNVERSPRGPIVVLDHQYPSNLYPWRDLAQRTGTHVVRVPQPVDGDWTAAVVAAVDDGASLVAVPNCHFMTGAVLDLAAIGAAARKAGAMFVVDATQSLGVMPLDVHDIGADVVVAAGYKWLLGPYSVGYMWIAPRHRDWRPLEHHWAGRRGSDDFAALTHYTDEHRPGARRFDVGEASNFVLLPMAITALETVGRWSVAGVAAVIAPLSDTVTTGAERLGLAPPRFRRAPHIVSLQLPPGAATRISDGLAALQIHVSVRGERLRVSPHVYNTADDVERFIDALGRLV